MTRRRHVCRAAAWQRKPLGVVLGIQRAAGLVCLVFDGVWADRLPRQLLTIAGDLVRALVQALVALASFVPTPGIVPAPKGPS